MKRVAELHLDHSWYLIVDAEPSGALLASSLREMNRRVDLHSSMNGVFLSLEKVAEKPAVVLLETRMPEGLSTYFLPRLLAASPHTRFVILTAYGSIAGAVHAMRMGATNYLCKPLSAEALLHILRGGPEPAPSSFVPPSLDRAIWEYLQFVLFEEGTIAGAARRLRLQPRSLRRMLQKHPPSR